MMSSCTGLEKLDIVLLGSRRWSVPEALKWKLCCRLGKAVRLSCFADGSVCATRMIDYHNELRWSRCEWPSHCARWGTNRPYRHLMPNDSTKLIQILHLAPTVSVFVLRSAKTTLRTNRIGRPMTVETPSQTQKIFLYMLGQFKHQDYAWPMRDGATFL